MRVGSEVGRRADGRHRYCTYFDHRFLDRGLAMMRSLRWFDPNAELIVLCLTDSCARALRRLGEPGVTLIRLEDFERVNPDLLPLKSARSPRDYAFGLSSFLTEFVLRDVDPDEVVTYLDADLHFYSDPAPLFEAMAGASIGLVGHRHHWWARRLEKYGRFNVGWVSFRNDETGRAAAQWWRARCIEWCHGEVDGDRFADQKYLDHMFGGFSRVVEISHVGANVGPWNICRHSVTRMPGGRLVVDGRYPLIFFHYSGLMETRPGTYLCSNVSYLAPLTRTVRETLYKPYIATLAGVRREIGDLPEEATPDLRGSPPVRRYRYAFLFRLAGWLAGHYVKVRGDAAGAVQSPSNVTLAHGR